MNKKLIIIIVVVLVLVGGGLAAYFIFFAGDDEEKEPEPEKVFEFELGKTMTYLSKDSQSTSRKQVYVQYNPVVFYTDEATLEILTEKRTLISSEIEKYFNTKTQEKIVKMRGKNVEEDKDRIEIDLQERVSELLGELGENITRVSLLGFVIN